MSEFLELAKKRQSCREFSERPVERETLERCVEAARLAPSACNSQPWRFLVAESPAVVAHIAKAGQPSGFNPFLDKAKAFVVIVEEHAVLMPRLRESFDSQYFAKGDLGAAVAYLCLQAAAQGLGACQIGLFSREEICKALGLAPETRINALVAFGYPAHDETRPKSRKPLEEIARFV